MKVEQVLELLDQMFEDTSIPRNVRDVLKKVRDDLKSDRELGVKIDSAIAKVEGLSLDPNLLAHARAQIWNLTFLLSEVSD